MPASSRRACAFISRAASDLLAPGDRVETRASLYPVPGQILPGAHDMQREAYFAQIGGVGYSYGRRTAPPTKPTTAGGGWREALRHLRTEMTRRIIAVLPGSTGGVASALITGKRGAIAEEVKEAFRQSGLSHLLAIAGLHLGLVGGFVFFTVRGGLALIPCVALRYPIKKIAAAATLVVLFCYLMLSGAAIPTERAFVMNGIVFAAILIDRLRISMRICALAAAVVLALEPESLVGVSFQMSFGAVVALIAVYETWGSRLGRLLHRRSWPGRVLGYAGAVAVTTVVVTIGTEPFSIYHFHHLALYSPLANVIAVPISAMWTLPWGVVACLLMPFGLERLALVPMGWGIDATIWVAAGGLGVARQCLADAATADRGAGAGRVRRVVAVPVAQPWRRWGHCRDRRRAGRHGADPAARHRASPISAGFSRCGARRRLLSGRRSRGADRGLVSRARRPASNCLPWPPGDAATSARLRSMRCAAIRRAGALSRSSPEQRLCRSTAAASTRSSARCRPGSAAARSSRSSTASIHGGCGAIALWLDARRDHDRQRQRQPRRSPLGAAPPFPAQGAIFEFRRRELRKFPADIRKNLLRSRRQRLSLSEPNEMAASSRCLMTP